MSAIEFHDCVFGLRRTSKNECNEFLSKIASEEIEEFFPNKNSYKIKGFLSALYWECENFEMDWDEEAFYNTIRNGFLKFQKIINEE